MDTFITILCYIVLVGWIPLLVFYREAQYRAYRKMGVSKVYARKLTMRS